MIAMGVITFMVFRQAKPEERQQLFEEGYKEWSKNRTFEQYCMDNRKEDSYGTRYIIEDDNEIVSSLILLNLKEVNGRKAFGIGSVLTPKKYSGKGYATRLINNCIELAFYDNCIIFLFSDINPEFYERVNFRRLPLHLQKYEKSICMAYCKDSVWEELINSSINDLPDYF